MIGSRIQTMSSKELWQSCVPYSGKDPCIDACPADKKDEAISRWFHEEEIGCDELSDFRAWMSEAGKKIYWLRNDSVTWQDLMELLQDGTNTTPPENLLGLQYPFLYDIIRFNLANLYDLTPREIDDLWNREKQSSLRGFTFVITGKLNNGTRSEYENIIKRAGGHVASKVTESTDFLVTNTPDSGSNKNRDANRLGVQKISEEKLEMMLKDK